MFVIDANSITHDYVHDPLGTLARNNYFPRGAVVSMLRSGGTSLLRQEADRIETCATLIGVVTTPSCPVVTRAACGSVLCPVCGARPGATRATALQRGLTHYYEAGVPQFFVTLSLPPADCPEDARLNAVTIFSRFVAALCEVYDIDWSRSVELGLYGMQFTSHIHAVIAVRSDVPRRCCRQRSCCLPPGFPSPPVHRSPIDRTVVENLFHAIAEELLERQFPGSRAANQDAVRVQKFCDVQPVVPKKGSMRALAGYMTKALRCGLSADHLRDASAAQLNTLLAAAKKPGADRAWRLNQSAVNSAYSRKQPKRRRKSRMPSAAGEPHPLRRKRPSRDKRAIAAATRKKIDDALSGRMSFAERQHLARTEGKALEVALKNDRDPRVFHFWWAVSRHAPDRTVLPPYPPPLRFALPGESYPITPQSPPSLGLPAVPPAVACGNVAAGCDLPSGAALLAGGAHSIDDAPGAPIGGCQRPSSTLQPSGGLQWPSAPRIAPLGGLPRLPGCQAMGTTETSGNIGCGLDRSTGSEGLRPPCFPLRE